MYIHRETRRETETMTKLTLVSDYHYTQQPRDYTYYVYYKLQDVVYTDTLDIDTRQADRIVDYVTTHYNKMMMGDTKPILIVEDAVEEGTLAEAVILLKEAARKAMLSAIQEGELIQKVCGWAGQGTYQQDPTLPQGYEGRTVIPYPYTPALPDNLWHYRVHDIRSTPYTTEVCGIRIVLVTSKQGYPVHTYDTCTYYDALGRIGCTAEEASQAIRRLSNAMYAEGQYTQALNSMSHAEGRGTYTQEEEDSLFTKYTLYSVPTPEGKPVRLAYEDKDTDTQQHSDTHTHIQQEDTHTCTGSMVDTHTHTHIQQDTYTDRVIDIHPYTQQEDTCADSMAGTHTDTHVQQEDATHVYNTEDTHYCTRKRTDSMIDTYTDNVVDTHILTHNDVVYDTQEIDTYIHSIIDIH